VISIHRLRVLVLCGLAATLLVLAQSGSAVARSLRRHAQASQQCPFADAPVNSPASGARAKQGTADTTATSTGPAPADTVAPQPSMAKQDAGSGIADAAKSDPSADASSAVVPATPAHDHSTVAVTADAPAASPDPRRL